MFFHETDGCMIPYLGPDFVWALLGLDACDGSPFDLDNGEPLVTPARMKAQSRAAAEKKTLSEWVDPNINACCFSDSDSLVITPGDKTNPETFTTSHRARPVMFSLWNRLSHWLNKHTGARERWSAAASTGVKS